MHKQSLIILCLLISWSVFSQTSLKIGDYAPEITLKEKHGDIIKLSESTGSLTIVHFWASWSKPCKPMNQYLSQAYSKYKKEGLEIFSVSIDKKPRTWFEAIENQKLDQVELVIDPNHYANVVLASKGYPENYNKGFVITGLEKINRSIVFHAGTLLKDNTVLTNGGRVISVVSSADNFKEALKQSYESIGLIEFEGKIYRKDIGFDL